MSRWPGLLEGAQRVVITLDLPPEPMSATRARQRTREHLASWCPADAVDTAALLVTELVTNAVLHARTSILVIVELTPGRVVLRVADKSDAVPLQRAFAPDAATGRGLALVEELATSWGVERSPNGKEVWCEIEFPPEWAGQASEAGS